MSKLVKSLVIILLMFISGIKIQANEKKTITYERLIASIAYVESKQNPNIVSKNKTYAGYLQISKVCVDEVNKLLGEKRFKYSDRLDKDKSIEMFHIFQKYHNPKQDIYLAARLWSEGLIAKKRKYTITPYVKKVMKLYNGKYSHLEE